MKNETFRDKVSRRIQSKRKRKKQQLQFATIGNISSHLHE